MKKLTKSLLAMTLVVSSVGLVTMVSAMPFADGAGCGRGGHHMGHSKHHGGGGPNLERLADRNPVRIIVSHHRMIIDDQQADRIAGGSDVTWHERHHPPQ